MDCSSGIYFYMFSWISLFKILLLTRFLFNHFLFITTLFWLKDLFYFFDLACASRGYTSSLFV
jgi:hypothetical protein